MYRIRRMHLISHIIKQQQVSSICCIIKYLPRLYKESVADTAFVYCAPKVGHNLKVNEKE